MSKGSRIKPGHVGGQMSPEPEPQADAPDSGARARAEAICRRIAEGTPIKHAAALEGVPKATWYDLVGRDADVALMVAHASAEASERRRIAFESGGGSSHALMLMQTLDPECYPRPRERVETSGPDGGPIQQQHSGSVSVTLAEAEAGIARLAAKGTP